MADCSLPQTLAFLCAPEIDPLRSQGCRRLKDNDKAGDDVKSSPLRANEIGPRFGNHPCLKLIKSHHILVLVWFGFSPMEMQSRAWSGANNGPGSGAVVTALLPVTVVLFKSFTFGP